VCFDFTYKIKLSFSTWVEKITHFQVKANYALKWILLLTGSEKKNILVNWLMKLKVILGVPTEIQTHIKIVYITRFEKIMYAIFLYVRDLLFFMYKKNSLHFYSIKESIVFFYWLIKNKKYFFHWIKHQKLVPIYRDTNGQVLKKSITIMTYFFNLTWLTCERQ